MDQSLIHIQKQYFLRKLRQTHFLVLQESPWNTHVVLAYQTDYVIKLVKLYYIVFFSFSEHIKHRILVHLLYEKYVVESVHLLH